MRKDPLLARVPANVPRRDALLLSGRDVLAGEAGERLLVAQCGPEAVAPVLRAARQLDAVVGIAPLGSRPLGFVEHVIAVAEAVGLRRAFCAASPVLRLDAGPEAARDSVEALIGAGFTHLVVDAQGLPEAEIAERAVRALAPAAERELGTEVLLPDGLLARAEPLAFHMEAMGVRPDVLSGRAGAWTAASPRVPTGGHEGRGAPEAVATAARRAGLRLLRLAHPFALEADTADPDRAEAKVHAAAAELLERLGAAGSAGRLRRRLRQA